MPRAYKNKWDKSWYDYYNLTKQTSTADLSSEYNRMKKEASRRLGALSRSKNETAQNLARNYGDILGKKPRNKAGLAKSVIAMEHFLSLKSSRVSQIHAADRQRLDTLHSHGYDFVTKNNLAKFGKFMDALRERQLISKGASSSAMDFLTDRKQIGSNAEALADEFEAWLESKEGET